MLPPLEQMTEGKKWSNDKSEKRKPGQRPRLVTRSLETRLDDEQKKKRFDTSTRYKRRDEGGIPRLQIRDESGEQSLDMTLDLAL